MVPSYHRAPPSVQFGQQNVAFYDHPPHTVFYPDCQFSSLPQTYAVAYDNSSFAGNLPVQSRGYQQQLPCQQQLEQQWDYNTMCYNAAFDNSMPCQFTAPVDIEDFMYTEKRKEKSRDAARCRRSREADLYADLSALLPMKREDVDHLDKASIMRLAIAYLRVRNASTLLSSQIPRSSEVETSELTLDLSYLSCLDGFVFVVSDVGDIVYLSDNVVDYLGIMQSDLMGHSVFDFSHPCDHDELRDALRSCDVSASISMLLRLKCTLTSKGRNVNLKSASYKVINLTGHILTSDEEEQAGETEGELNNNESVVKNEKLDSSDAVDKPPTSTIKLTPKVSMLIAIGRPIPHPSYIETPLGSKMFLSKHSVNMQFTYVDSTILEMLGYEPGDLIGKSMYEFHHAMESQALVPYFKGLFAKGQSETCPYRFLAKRGGYAWVETQASVMYDRNKRPLSVVCINQVLSGIECKDEIYSISQLNWSMIVESPKCATTTAAPAPSEPTPAPAPAAVFAEIKTSLTEAPSEGGKLARRATAEIFAQSKKEMNKGMFLMFSDEDPNMMMLKEEPADLSHLAPAAGDECISLDNPSFDMFHDLILDDSYNLLPDGLDSLDSAEVSFLDYRDDSQLSDNSPSDFLLSPSNSKDSDNLLTPCESPSSEDLLNNISESSMADYQSLAYMPASEDDLPLIGSGDMVMWGALPEHVNIHKEIRKSVSPKSTTPIPKVINAPSLARLLADPMPQLPVETTDLLNGIYSEPNVLSAWNNEEAPTTVEPVEMSDVTSERASKRAIHMDDNDRTKRQKCDAVNLLQHLINKTDSTTNSQPAPSPKTASRNPPPQANSVLMNLLVSGCDPELICKFVEKNNSTMMPHLSAHLRNLKRNDNRKGFSSCSYSSKLISSSIEREKYSEEMLPVHPHTHLPCTENERSFVKIDYVKDPLLHCTRTVINEDTANSTGISNFDEVMSDVNDYKLELGIWKNGEFLIEDDMLSDFNM